MSMHDKAIKELTAADYLVIEKEHKLLNKFLNDLKYACSCSNLDESQSCKSCGHEKEASCQGRLPSFLFYAIDVASTHFDHEETIMLSRPHVTDEYEYFRAHRQEHERIIQKLNLLVEECFSLETQGNTPEIYRKFHKKLSDMFEEHDRLFDDPFIASTQHESTRKSEIV